MLWSDRRGGVSEGRYATLNLGDHVGDSERAVAENRRRFAIAVHSAVGAVAEAPGSPGDGASLLPLVFLRQVHGSAVHVVASHEDLRKPGGPPEADAAVTAVPGIGVVALTADCVPVALACDGAVGVVHAGWQGLLGGVVEETVGVLRRLGRGRVKALVGPCVHAGHYEFGAADLDRVAERLGPGVIARTGAGAPALDLPAATKAALALAGVDGAEVEDLDVCTAGSDHHFSHRRDGITGRQALVAVLP